MSRQALARRSHLEHVYRAHWNPGQLLIVNACKDGVRDCTEPGVDSGGECL